MLPPNSTLLHYTLAKHYTTYDANLFFTPAFADQVSMPITDELRRLYCSTNGRHDKGRRQTRCRPDHEHISTSGVWGNTNMASRPERLRAATERITARRERWNSTCAKGLP